MKKFLDPIRRYLRTAADASYKVGFYRRIDERKPADAVGHLTVLVLALWVLPVAVGFFMLMRDALDAFNTGLRTQVPPGTVFEMKGGRLTTSLEDSLVFRDESGEFVVIVNSASSTLDLAEGEAGIVVHADAIVQKDASGSYETMPFSRAPDFRVTREEIDEWVGRFAPLAIFLTSFLLLLGVSVAAAFAAGGMVLLYAALLWGAAKIARRPWPFRRTFLIAAYAASVPVIAKAVFALSGIDGGIIPAALYWILLAAVLYDARKERGGRDERKEEPPADRPHTEGQAGPV